MTHPEEFDNAPKAQSPANPERIIGLTIKLHAGDR